MPRARRSPRRIRLANRWLRNMDYQLDRIPGLPGVFFRWMFRKGGLIYWWAGIALLVCLLILYQRGDPWLAGITLAVCWGALAYLAHSLRQPDEDPNAPVRRL